MQEQENIQTIQQVLSQLLPQENAPDLDSITLTDEEIAAALNTAKIKKQLSIEEELRLNKRKRLTEYCNTKFTFKEQYEVAGNIAALIVKNTNPEHTFVIDDVLQDEFIALCWYFTNDKRFETNGYGSLSKGLFVSGNNGTGKTLLMQAFSRNKRQCFEITPSKKIVENFLLNSKVEDAIETIIPYYRPKKALFGTFEYFLQPEIGLCIDDVGAEECPVKKFGTTFNIIEKIIWERYVNKVPFYMTHFTTNLDANGIEKLYGTRIKDRLAEMINFIEIKGESRR